MHIHVSSACTCSLRSVSLHLFTCASAAQSERPTVQVTSPGQENPAQTGTCRKVNNVSTISSKDASEQHQQHQHHHCSSSISTVGTLPTRTTATTLAIRQDQHDQESPMPSSNQFNPKVCALSFAVYDVLVLCPWLERIGASDHASEEALRFKMLGRGWNG